MAKLDIAEVWSEIEMTETFLSFVWTAIYAITGAWIGSVDRDATAGVFLVWSSSYGAVGAGMSSVLLLVTMSA